MTEARTQLASVVRVDSGRLVVTVSGWIDAASVGEFHALAAQVLAVGARRVLFDMSGAELLDAGGTTVLLMAAERLRSTGGTLAVRGVKAPYREVFEIHHMTHDADVARPGAGPGLIDGLVGVAAIPQARDVLDAALKLVVTMAQSVVVGADGVSITLPRNGQLGTVAASNDIVLQMDHDQYDTGEGPCLDAATQGLPFHSDSLAKESRWPAFVLRANARGIGTILSAPLLNADRPVGALNLYSRTVGAFAAHELLWAEQFAAEASAVVAAAESDGSGDLLTGQIGQALQSRDIIATAQGVIMQRDSVPAQRAYAELRDISGRTGQPLREVCAIVVAGAGAGALTGGPSDGSPDGRPPQ